MNRSELERYATAFRKTGLTFATRQRDHNGNVRRIEPIPWEQAVALIVARLGWTLVEEEPPQKTSVLLFPPRPPEK